METGLVVSLMLVGLGLFGVIYNLAAARLEGARRDHGYTAMLVVGGVLVTLGGMGVLDLVVDWNAFFIGLACFAASGAPMVVGSMLRNLEERAVEERKVKQLTLDLLNEDGSDWHDEA